MLRDASDPAALRQCPFCREMIPRAATVCKFCTRDLPQPKRLSVVWLALIVIVAFVVILMVMT